MTQGELNVPSPSLLMAAEEDEGTLNSQGTCKSYSGQNVSLDRMTKIKQQEGEQKGSFCQGTKPSQAEISFEKPPDQNIGISVPDPFICMGLYKERENTKNVINLKKMLPPKKVKTTEININDESTNDVNKKKTNELNKKDKVLLRAVSFQKTDDYSVDNGKEDAVDDIIIDGKEVTVDESINDRKEVAVGESIHTRKEVAVGESNNTSKEFAIGESIDNRKKVAVGKSINTRKKVTLDESINNRKEVAVGESFYTRNTRKKVAVGESIDNRKKVAFGKSINTRKKVAVGESIRTRKEVAVGKSINTRKEVAVCESIRTRKEVAVGESIDTRKEVAVGESIHTRKEVAVGDSINTRKKVAVGESINTRKEVAVDTASVGKGKKFATISMMSFLGLLVLILGLFAPGVGGKIVPIGEITVRVMAKVWSEVENDIISVNKIDTRRSVGDCDPLHETAEIDENFKGDFNLSLQPEGSCQVGFNLSQSQTTVDIYSASSAFTSMELLIEWNTSSVFLKLSSILTENLMITLTERYTLSVTMDRSNLDITLKDKSKNSVDSGLEEGSVDSGLEEGSVDSGLEEGSVDSGLEEGTIDSGLEEGSIDSGLGEGSVDSGLEEGSVDSGLEEGSVDSGLEEGSVDSGLGEGSVDSGLGKGQHPVEYRLSKGAKAGIAVLVILLISSNIVWAVCWRKKQTGARNGEDIRNGTGADIQNGQNADSPERFQLVNESGDRNEV